MAGVWAGDGAPVDQRVDVPAAEPALPGAPEAVRRRGGALWQHPGARRAMTPQEFVRHLERTAEALEEELVAAEEMSLRDLQREAEALSQGPLQPADLKRLGHPYSRKRGASLNPDI